MGTSGASSTSGKCLRPSVCLFVTRLWLPPFASASTLSSGSGTSGTISVPIAPSPIALRKYHPTWVCNLVTPLLLCYDRQICWTVLTTCAGDLWYRFLLTSLGSLFAQVGAFITLTFFLPYIVFSGRPPHPAPSL